MTATPWSPGWATRAGAARNAGSTGTLLFRRYRRVVGMLILDTIHTRAGYFCDDCRKRQFKQHMGLTLALGWWGVLALTMRNPYAIAVNLKSRWAQPRNAKKYGAVSLDVSGVEREPAPVAQ
jgi:hypothetical protein